MHDPMTVAHEIRLPLPWKRDKWTLKSEPKAREWASYHLATIWHVDPCKPGFGGSDDTCGWFMRAHHGNPEVLEKIIKRFSFDWDSTFKSEGSGKVYFTGIFYPEDAGAGMPNMGVTAVALNLFFLAVGEYFASTGHTNWKRARKWMQDNLFDIMFFAENPTDSLRAAIVRQWGTEKNKEERIREFAAIIYGYILRREQKWWRHPRWHVHHWQIQIHFTQTLKRWLFTRCCRCGKRFPWGGAVCTGNWNGTGPRWFRGESGVYHPDCEDVQSSGCCDATPKAV